MVTPRTPARPRAVDLSSTLSKTDKPTAPFLSTTITSPARPHLLSPDAPHKLAKSARTAPSATTARAKPSSPAGEGWTLSPDGCIVAVHAPTHVIKLSPYCSWLHQFEHARYLHAGVPQGAISWPSYPYRIQDGIEHPHLEQMHAHLAALPSTVPVRRPDSSLWTEIPYCESKAELQAAFQQGSVHFSGSLVDDKDKVNFKLSPPAAGMGSALYRRFGSDRFFRITFDDKFERRVGAPLDGRSASGDDPFRERVRTFLAHPLVIFGRQFRPFCYKDGAIVYWCESGPGIETIPLVDFAQRYLEVELNGSMSVAKYAARFELGLTTTTPTVTFRRDQVLRTPDANAESLSVSLGAMRAVCDEFRRRRPGEARELLPGSYLPSCIRGTVQQHPGGPLVDMVWRLDYTTIPPSRPTTTPPSSSSAAPADLVIQLRPFATEPSRPARPLLRFSLEAKDGSRVRILAPDGLKIDWVDDEGRTARSGAHEEVVMTDGCSLMSLAAMRELSSKYAASRRDSELQPAVPCLAQGRVGLGKGVWAADHHSPWTSEHWIEIRDSQWKAKDGQSRSFTFELHSVPSGKGGSKLGKQMFEILAHCGVPTSAFRSMLRSQVELCQDAFWKSPSPAALLYHVEKTCGVLEDRTIKARMASDPRSVKPLAREGSSGSLDEDEAVVVVKQQGDTGDFCHDGRLDPSSAALNVVAEVVVEMLQAGFDPRDDPHLADKLHMVTKGCVKKQIGFRIQDDWSRSAFVIADHLGVLDEGEFHFQVSEPLPAPNGHGQVRNVLGPTLLSRSPAVQPCDVQLATGVFRPEYASFFDAIIVSSKGERSLCSILSGGDYDGDKLTVITNPELVSSFLPARADPAFAEPPFADSDWFTVDRRRVADVVEPLIKAGDNSALASIFLEGFHLGNQYGTLSTLHTTLAYSLGLDHPLTRETGHLFCKALDGRKQGLSFSPAQWRAVKDKFALKHPHKPEWTFCDNGEEAPSNDKFAKRSRGLGLHPMDEILVEGRQLVKDVGVQWEAWARAHSFQLDEDLAVEWRRACNAALLDREAAAPSSSAYFEDLCAIRDHVRRIFLEYKNLFAMWRRDAALRKSAESYVGAPGSPSKSPSKRAKGWSGSSRSQKDDLRELSGRFWALVSDSRGGGFKSRELQGEVGRRTARALLASFAYLDPLEPVPEPPAVGHKPLLDRLQDCALAPPRSLATAAVKSLEASSSIVLPATEIVVTTPAGEDEEMGDDSFGDGDISWSQVPDDLTQTALTSLDTLPSSTSSRTAATTSLSSSAAPLSPSKAPLVAVAARTRFRGRPCAELEPKAPFRFCYDMAHRDMLGLKADSLARRLHEGHAGASGIQASKIAPHMLDVLQVSKRCAGITSSRTRVRPRTLLAAPDELETLGSPAKKARWA